MYACYNSLVPYAGPRHAISSVLTRLGIDPRERIAEHDQDPEYTSCRAAEVDDYYNLFQSNDLDGNERQVLCCFLLEGLNELIQIGSSHPLRPVILRALFDTREVHASELAYWMDTSDPDEQNWWPITRPLLDAARARDEEDRVAVHVQDAVASITDPRVAAALRRHLVRPRSCLLQWDYGHPHPEFAEPKYPGFIVAEFPESRTGIAFSTYGFGPRDPWGLIYLDQPGYGMDSGWFSTIESAFRESMAWEEPPPPGYEVP
jgi:hypothetical protein